uniref:Uncharacterized protein n=1 Tax=Phenylobacterium glaciei TaxID=2803784 RepID=A0A974P5T6_9CAUL|nr:hypothetical protein JKL49_12865 [Phenylobacterium glaciei]
MAGPAGPPRRPGGDLHRKRLCGRRRPHAGRRRRYPIPLREDQRRIAPGEADYSTNKVAMEDALLAGARVPLKILRPFAVHGPGSRAPREWWFLAQILRGAQTIPWPLTARASSTPRRPPTSQN